MAGMYVECLPLPPSARQKLTSCGFINTRDLKDVGTLELASGETPAKCVQWWLDHWGSIYSESVGLWPWRLCNQCSTHKEGPFIRCILYMTVVSGANEIQVPLRLHNEPICILYSLSRTCCRCPPHRNFNHKVLVAGDCRFYCHWYCLTSIIIRLLYLILTADIQASNINTLLMDHWDSDIAHPGRQNISLGCSSERRLVACLSLLWLLDRMTCCSKLYCDHII